MSDLAKKNCVPCKGGISPLKGNELATLLATLGGGWKAVGEHHLEKEYKFKNFREARDFTNRAGELAEAQGHHPDIHLAWGKVRLTILGQDLTSQNNTVGTNASSSTGEGVTEACVQLPDPCVGTVITEIQCLSIDEIV